MSVFWKVVGRSYACKHLLRILALVNSGIHDQTAYRRVISTTTALKQSDDSNVSMMFMYDIVCLNTFDARTTIVDDNCHYSLIRSTANAIPKDRLTIKFARSSGPGGQNVNKVNTKVDIRFHVQRADWLSQEVRDKLIHLEKNRINRAGELVVSSTKFRSQTRNLEDAVEKIADMIEKASYIPKETTREKKAHVRKLIRKANERRLAEKKFRSSKKSDRKMDD